MRRGLGLGCLLFATGTATGTAMEPIMTGMLVDAGFAASNAAAAAYPSKKTAENATKLLARSQLQLPEIEGETELALLTRCPRTARRSHLALTRSRACRSQG